MRAIMVAGSAFALAAVFGAGVVVGRFVLDQPGSPVQQPATALPGLSGLDDPLGNPDALLEGDPSLIAPPPVPPRPLPPATAPGLAGSIDAMAAARAESDAAQLAGACSVRVSKQMPVRDWNEPGQVVAEANGDTCGRALVRLTLQGRDGAVLYAMSAPAADFGLGEGATPDQLRAALDQALPNSARRASAYEGWTEGSAGPAGTEFDRQGYEAVRAGNAPVICLRVPSAPSRCIAADPTGGTMRVFSRG